LNWFGFITPNEWNAFQQLHTTLEAIVLSNRLKELIWKNKLKYRLGPDGYKAATPLWTKRKHDVSEARIPDPLEGCTSSTRN
jgi:hypothetical protein